MFRANESRVGSSLPVCAIVAVCLGESPRNASGARRTASCQPPKMTPSTALSLQLAFLNQPSVQDIRCEFLLAPLFGVQLHHHLLHSSRQHPREFHPSVSTDGTMAASTAAGPQIPLPGSHQEGRCAVVMLAGTAYCVRMCRRSSIFK